MSRRFSKIARCTVCLIAVVAMLRARVATTAGASRGTGSLASAGSMTLVRAGHTMTLLPGGSVLIVGGFAGSGTEKHPYEAAEVYHPAKGAFAAAASLATGRSGHTATSLGNGKVLIAGGWGPEGPLDSAELYDPATRAFKPAGHMTTRRAGHTATLLLDGKVLLAGGETDEGAQLAGAELYDPATGRFIPTGNMFRARAQHTATLLKNGQVLIAGGSAGRYPSATVHRSAELYDPATGQFTLTGSMTAARHKHGAVRLIDGRVLVVGGSDNRDWRGEYSSAEVYNPATRTFSPTGNMAVARFKLPAALVLLETGEVLVAGGGERVEIYDPARGVFTTTAGSLGAARFYAAAIRLSDGNVLITGGYWDDKGELPSTASAWIYRSIPPAP